LHVWKSDSSEQFIRQPDLNPLDGKFSLPLEADSIYSITTTTGQQKGNHGTPPGKKAFPFPYREDFEGYTTGQSPRYLSDQKGTFEVVDRPGGGRSLAQIVTQQGILWYDNKLLKPHTLFGDKNWRDYAVSADVWISGGDVEIGGRYAHRDNLGYRLLLSRDGSWQLKWQLKTLASGKLENLETGRWHNLRLVMQGDRIQGFLDAKELASLEEKSGGSGMAFLACTYDRNLFDNLAVTQP
jgi:galactosylceramidase